MSALLDHPWCLTLAAATLGLTISLLATGYSLAHAAARPTPADPYWDQWVDQALRMAEPVDIDREWSELNGGAS